MSTVLQTQFNLDLDMAQQFVDAKVREEEKCRQCSHLSFWINPGILFCMLLVKSNDIDYWEFTLQLFIILAYAQIMLPTVSALQEYDVDMSPRTRTTLVVARECAREQGES